MGPVERPLQILQHLVTDQEEGAQALSPRRQVIHGDPNGGKLPSSEVEEPCEYGPQPKRMREHLLDLLCDHAPPSRALLLAPGRRPDVPNLLIGYVALPSSAVQHCAEAVPEGKRRRSHGCLYRHGVGALWCWARAAARLQCAGVSTRSDASARARRGGGEVLQEVGASRLG